MYPIWPYDVGLVNGAFSKVGLLKREMRGAIRVDVCLEVSGQIGYRGTSDLNQKFL